MFSVSTCDQASSSNEFQAVENKTKRGRGGKGSRGSYKPRGRCKNAGNSFSSSYSYSNSSNHSYQKVCINPEILRRFGYL